MRSIRLACRMAAVVLAISALASCESGSPQTDPPRLATTPRPSTDGTIKSPLNEYFPSAEGEATMAEATDVLARRCLRRYGFRIEYPVVTGGVVSELRELDESLFIPEKQARKHGFSRLPEKPGKTTAKKHRRSGHLNREEVIDMLTVLNGTPPLDGRAKDKPASPTAVERFEGKNLPRHGCRGEASEKLSAGMRLPVRGQSPGGELDAVNYVQGLRRQASERLEDDHRVKKVTEQWKRCFKEKTGLSYPNPYAAARDPKWIEDDKASSEEISAAVAHTRCQLRLNYLGVVESLMAAYEKRAETQNKTDLQSVDRFFDARIKRSERMVRQAN